MLEQLMQLIQQQAQQSVVENNAVPNEHNEAVMQEAQNTITSGLQQMAANGNIQQLTQMVQNGQDVNAHPAVQQMSGDFMGSIMQKFGLDSKAASGIAASIIPMVLGKVLGGNNGTGTSGSGFDLGGLLRSITGGANSSGGFMQQASNIGAKLGLDKDGDGDVDLSDITKMFKG